MACECAWCPVAFGEGNGLASPIGDSSKMGAVVGWGRGFPVGCELKGGDKEAPLCEHVVAPPCCLSPALLACALSAFCAASCLWHSQ